jgi:hypothetical protein
VDPRIDEAVTNEMNTNSPSGTGSSERENRRQEWRREVYSVAEALRRSGGQRRLRDVTIVLPIDHTAVEAIELACLALAEGELSHAANELDRFLDRLATDAMEAERFVPSLRSVARRVGSIGPRP